MALSKPGQTDRTTLNRLKKRSVEDRDEMYEILDSTILCHVGYVENGQPFILPYAFARDGDRILIHGSSGARFMRELAKGVPTCVTVTKLDGMVVARTTFDSSMNYRSVVILGAAEEINGPEKNELLEKVSNGLLPGRVSEVRTSTAKDLQQQPCSHCLWRRRRSRLEPECQRTERVLELEFGPELFRFT